MNFASADHVMAPAPARVGPTGGEGGGGGGGGGLRPTAGMQKFWLARGAPPTRRVAAAAGSLSPLRA